MKMEKDIAVRKAFGNKLIRPPSKQRDTMLDVKSLYAPRVLDLEPSLSHYIATSSPSSPSQSPKQFSTSACKQEK